MDENELALTMSQDSILIVCDCSSLGQCNCPPIPTHMIQGVQENELLTDVNLFQHFS